MLVLITARIEGNPLNVRVSDIGKRVKAYLSFREDLARFREMYVLQAALAHAYAQS